jgi:hypothetical protein
VSVKQKVDDTFQPRNNWLIHFVEGSSLKEELDTDKLLLLTRSFEVGADKTATLESILNLLQVNKFSETFCLCKEY